MNCSRLLEMSVKVEINNGGILLECNNTSAIFPALGVGKIVTSNGMQKPACTLRY